MPLLQPPRTKRLKRTSSRTRGVIFRVLGVIIVIVLVELGARGCVNAVTSRSIESGAANVRKVNVASGDVPAVFHFFILGSLRNGSITMHDIMAAPVNISSLSVTAQNLRFSRGAMIKGRASLKGSPPYRTTVFLSAKNIGDALGTSVTFQSNYLVATIDGHNMNVVPKVKGRKIVIADDKYSYDVPLPGTQYLPCKPATFGVGNGVWVSCDSAVLPRFVAASMK